MSTSHITTHVLDTGSGKPAAGVAVTLHMLDGERWVGIAAGATDDDGRVKSLGPDRLPSGTYRLGFDTGTYLRRRRDRDLLPRSDADLRRVRIPGPLPRPAPAEPLRLLHLPGQLRNLRPPSRPATRPGSAPGTGLTVRVAGRSHAPARARALEPAQSQSTFFGRTGLTGQHPLTVAHVTSILNFGIPKWDPKKASLHGPGSQDLHHLGTDVSADISPAITPTINTGQPTHRTPHTPASWPANK